MVRRVVKEIIQRNKKLIKCAFEKLMQLSMIKLGALHKQEFNLISGQHKKRKCASWIKLQNCIEFEHTVFIQTLVQSCMKQVRICTGVAQFCQFVFLVEFGFMNYNLF